MADNGTSLDILIRTIADTTGIQMTEAQIGKLKSSLDDSQVSLGKFGDANDDATQSIKKHGEGVEHLHINHRALAMGLREINPQLEQLGHLARFASGPAMGLTLGFLAAAGIYHMATEALKKWNEEMDKALEKAANPDFLAGIEAQKKVMAEAQAAADSYADKIAKIAEGENSIANDLERQLSLMKAIAEARGEAQKGADSLTIAKIKEMEASGQITKEQAEQRIAEEKRKEIELAAQAKYSEQVDEMSTKSIAKEKAEAAEPGLKANAEALRQTFETEKGRRDKTSVDFGDNAYEKKSKEDEKAVRLAQERYDKAGGKKIEELEENLRTNTNEFQKENLREMIAEMRPQVQAASDELNRAQNTQRLNNEGHGQFLKDKASQQSFDELGRRASDAEKLYTDNTTEIAKLNGELRSLTDALLATKADRDAATASAVGTVTSEYATGVAERTQKFITDDASVLKKGSGNHHDEAIIQLKESQKYGRELAQAAAEATAAHNANAGILIEELRKLRKANADLMVAIGGTGY